MTRFGLTEKVHAWHSLAVRHNISATNVKVCIFIFSILDILLNVAVNVCFLSPIHGKRFPRFRQVMRTFFTDFMQLLLLLSPLFFLYFLSGFLINILLVYLYSRRVEKKKMFSRDYCCAIFVDGFVYLEMEEKEKIISKMRMFLVCNKIRMDMIIYFNYKMCIYG